VQFDYFRLVFEIYCGLRRAGLTVDILPPSTESFEGLSLVLIPGLFAWTDPLRLAMSKFEGQIVVGPRTGSRTENFRILDDLPPGLDGIKVTAVDTLRADASEHLTEGGTVQIWRERVESDWTILESTRDGHPVRLRRDNIHYWAGWPHGEALDRWLGDLLGSDARDVDRTRLRRTAGSEIKIDYQGASVTRL
jgi:beta-galactosidase